MTGMSAAPTAYAELAQVIDRLPMLVREARRARGVSIRAAGRQMGLSFSTVSRFENGEGVTLNNAVLVLRWLDQRGTS